MPPDTPCTAFEGQHRIATGKLSDVALEVKKLFDRGQGPPILIFHDVTGEQIEIDVRGTSRDILKRLTEAPGMPGATVQAPSEAAPRGPGRPKLGVIAREVTLLPRHWDWLARQPGGASVALRKLVEDARRANAGKDRVRAAQEAAYRFLSAMGGNLPDFEEAARALFAKDAGHFRQRMAAWPADIRDHAARLAAEAFVTAHPG